MKQTHLVTGATGFVGAALVQELLRRTSHDIVAMVRPDSIRDPIARFRRAMVQAAELYQAVDVLDRLDRCRVVAGDLTEAGCGLAGHTLAGVSQVWHAAASLQFENRHRDKIHATNVEGTRRVLALAERLGVDAFNYVSTAYVAGRATGVIREARCDAVETNNHYERSKIEAEALVDAAPMRARILRPSIVVGHGQTCAATSFSGYYGFIRQVAQFRGMVERTQRGLLERTAVRLRLDPDADANLVCVDRVAHEAVTIGEREASEGVFHLTNPTPPKVGETVRSIFALLGLREPIFVAERGEFSWLDQQFDKRMDFYGSYIVGDKRFERLRTDAALGERAEHPELSVDALGRWYLNVLAQARSNLPVAR